VKIFKAVKIWQNYGHESAAPLFGPTCMSSCTTDLSACEHFARKLNIFKQPLAQFATTTYKLRSLHGDNFVYISLRGPHSMRYAVDLSVIKRSSVCLSVCLSCRSTAAAPTGGFAAEVGRWQQISIDSCCCCATCGQRKFSSNCKEVLHTC